MMMKRVMGVMIFIRILVRCGSLYLMVMFISSGMIRMMRVVKMFRKGIFILVVLFSLLVNILFSVQIYRGIIFVIYMLGKVFIDELGGVIKMDIFFLNIFIVFIILIVLLLVGVVIKYKFLCLIKVLMKIIIFVIFFVIIIFIFVGIYINFFIFKFFEFKVILVGFLLLYCGYIFFGIISLIL